MQSCGTQRCLGDSSLRVTRMALGELRWQRAWPRDIGLLIPQHPPSRIGGMATARSGACRPRTSRRSIGAGRACRGLPPNGWRNLDTTSCATLPLWLGRWALGYWNEQPSDKHPQQNGDGVADDEGRDDLRARIG